MAEIIDDIVETARIVDRYRHGDLGGRHHVNRRLESFEDFEQAPKEAVRHQHARGGDVDDRHVPLARDGRERPVRPAPVRGNDRAGPIGNDL